MAPTIPEDTAQTTTSVKTYQVYESARMCTQVITDKGKVAKFINHQYHTDDEHIIEYLEKQIKHKTLPGITKLGAMTEDELSPHEALRKKHIAEYVAAQEAMKVGAGGATRDMGSTELKSKINALTTKIVPTA